MRSIVIAILVSVMLAAPSTAGAAPLSVTDLDSDPTSWNGKNVTITGEIVGDYGRRSEVVWIQVNDDGYVDGPLAETGRLTGTNSGIGVRVAEELFDESWGAPGGYRTRGPIVSVTGVFRYADRDTGGDTFIEATGIELISASRPLSVPATSRGLVAISLLAVLAGAALLGRARWRRLNPET